MNQLADARTVGDIHNDETLEKILDLREEIGRLKSRVKLLERWLNDSQRENKRLKAMKNEWGRKG